MSFLDKASHILEPIYYFVSIGLFASVIIGLYQIKLLKEDMRVKNQRAALEKSIEYLDWFATDFFPLEIKTLDKFREAGRAIIQKAESEHKKALADQLNRKINFEIDENDKFIRTEKELDEYIIKTSLLMNSGVVDLLNQLEIFAAVMTCGVADEKMAFTPLSDVYCSSVENYYLVLCTLRRDNNKLYTNIIKLYGMWKSRINKQMLEVKHKEISDKMSRIPDSDVRPLGL